MQFFSFTFLSSAALLIFVTGYAESGFAATRSISIASIVTPPYSSSSTQKVIIYKIPKLLLNRSGALPNETGSFTINSTTVPGLPNSAIGVFLFVDAATPTYCTLHAPNDLTTPPSGIVTNLLQIGNKTDANRYSATTWGANYVYRDKNIFYLPLKSGVTHTVQWELGWPGSTHNQKLQISCVGYATE